MEDARIHEALLPRKHRSRSLGRILVSTFFLLCCLSLSFRTMTGSKFLSVHYHSEARRLGSHRKLPNIDQKGSTPGLPALYFVDEILPSRGEDKEDKALGSVEASNRSSVRNFKSCGPHLSLNEHFVDRDFWQNIPIAEYSARQRQWKASLARARQQISYKEMVYRGRGIIFTASGATWPYAFTSIRLLREVHRCKLPVQVWHLDNELTAKHMSEIRSIGGVTAMNMQTELKRQRKGFRGVHVGPAYGASRNYHIKTLAILLSRFEEVIYLDSDNMPLKNPELLFDSPEYIKTGALFWPDFWKFPEDNPMWRITGLECEDEPEQEAGQLVVNKRTAFSALFLSMHFQLNHKFYFKVILGDKDTFRFAWKLTSTPYFMIRRPVALGGRIRQGRFCGHTMLQFDTKGELVFAHGTAAKATHSLRLGNTWESIQYFDSVNAYPSDGNTTRHSSRVNHPRESQDTKRAESAGLSIPTVSEYYDRGADLPLEEGGFGAETFANPCIDLSYKVLSPAGGGVTTVAKGAATGAAANRATAAAAASNPSPPFSIVRVMTEPLQSYNHGELSWFEKTYYELGGPDSRAHELESFKRMLSPGSFEEYDEEYLQMMVTALQERASLSEFSSILAKSGINVN